MSKLEIRTPLSNVPLTGESSMYIGYMYIGAQFLLQKLYNKNLEYSKGFWIIPVFYA